MLRGGTVAIGGSTGAVLARSLRAMQDLINNSLTGARLDSGLGQRRRVAVSGLIAEAEVEASMGAEVAGLGLAVAPVAPGIDVQIDQQVVSAAISNLPQNAFKFTRPQPRHAARDREPGPRSDRGGGRVRRPTAGQGRGPVPSLRVAERQSDGTGPRALHQPQGR